MAATWTGEIKAALSAVSALGGRVFRADDNLDGVETPYVTVLDPVADTSALRGDGATLGRTRQIDVNLWQQAGSPGDAVRDAVRDALDGAEMMDSRLYVRQVVAVPRPPDETLQHHALTVQTREVV